MLGMFLSTSILLYKSYIFQTKLCIFVQINPNRTLQFSYDESHKKIQTQFFLGWPPKVESGVSHLTVFYDFPREMFCKSIFGLNRDLNPGPLAPKARIIPLDHWASCILKRQIWKYNMGVTNSKVFWLEPVFLKLASIDASIAQWQSVGLVNQRSWVQSSLEANCFLSLAAKTC